MKTNGLIQQWKSEETIAHIRGWDCSHITGFSVDKNLEGLMEERGFVEGCIHRFLLATRKKG